MATGRHHTRQMILEGMGPHSRMDVTLERGDTAWEPVPVRSDAAGWTGPAVIRYTRQPGGNVTAQELPQPRPLTVPEQRALEAMAGTEAGRPIVTARTGYSPVLDELWRRDFATIHVTRASRCYRITDQGRAYLRTLGVDQ